MKQNLNEYNIYVFPLPTYGWVKCPSSCCNGTEVAQLLSVVQVSQKYCKKHSPTALQNHVLLQYTPGVASLSFIESCNRKNSTTTMSSLILSLAELARLHYAIVSLINPTFDFHHIPGARNHTNTTILIKVMDLPLAIAMLDATVVAFFGRWR